MSDIRVKYYYAANDNIVDKVIIHLNTDKAVTRAMSFFSLENIKVNDAVIVYEDQYDDFKKSNSDLGVDIQNVTTDQLLTTHNLTVNSVVTIDNNGNSGNTGDGGDDGDDDNWESANVNITPSSLNTPINTGGLYTTCGGSTNVSLIKLITADAAYWAIDLPFVENYVGNDDSLDLDDGLTIHVSPMAFRGNSYALKIDKLEGTISAKANAVAFTVSRYLEALSSNTITEETKTIYIPILFFDADFNPVGCTKFNFDDYKDLDYREFLNSLERPKEWEQIFCIYIGEGDSGGTVLPPINPGVTTNYKPKFVNNTDHTISFDYVATKGIPDWSGPVPSVIQEDLTSGASSIALSNCGSSISTNVTIRMLKNTTASSVKIEGNGVVYGSISMNPGVFTINQSTKTVNCAVSFDTSKANDDYTITFS